jgi:hypothetical protein
MPRLCLFCCNIFLLTPPVKIPFNATTVYLGAGATGSDLGTVTQPETRVIGIEDGVWIDKLVLAASGIVLENFKVSNLTAKELMPVEGLELRGIDNVEPFRLQASPQNGSIALEGTYLDANIVTILRHTGTVTCAGDTFCVVMDSVGRKTSGGTVERQDGATVADLNELTAVFGAEYTIEFVDVRFSLPCGSRVPPKPYPSVLPSARTRTCSMRPTPRNSHRNCLDGPSRPPFQFLWPTETSFTNLDGSSRCQKKLLPVFPRVFCCTLV